MSGNFDMTEFRQRLQVLEAHVAGASRMGLIDAGEQVLGDAQQLAPVNTGALVGSATLDDSKAEGGEVTIGFNVNYAAAVHEREDVHHAQGQSKYLETAVRTGLPRVNQALGQRIAREGLR